MSISGKKNDDDVFVKWLGPGGCRRAETALNLPGNKVLTFSPKRKSADRWWD